MLHPADVVVHRHPRGQHPAVPRRGVIAGVAVAQVVPAGVDEGVHRVGLAPRRAPAARAGGVHPVLGRSQRGLAPGLVVLDLGEPHREIGLGHRHHPAVVAVDDRNRAAPVALAGDEPVAQAVVDRGPAPALGLQASHDGVAAGHGIHAAELARVDEHLVGGVGSEGLLGDVGVLGIGGRDHGADRQLERRRELVVALVVGGDAHHRAGPVLHEDVVGDEHRDLLAVDGIGDRAAQGHAGLGLVGRAACLRRLVERAVDVLVDPGLVLGAGRQPEHVGVLGGHDEERRAEQGVGPRGEDRVVDVERIAMETRPPRPRTGRSSCAASP